MKDRKLMSMMSVVLPVSLLLISSCAPNLKLTVDRPPTFNTSSIQRIAVMPFDGQGGERLHQHITISINNNLHATGQFTMVEPAEVERLKREGKDITQIVDALVSGNVFYASEYTTSSSYTTKDKNGKVTIHTTYSHNATVGITYRLTSAKDGRYIGSESKTGRYVESSTNKYPSGSNLYGAANNILRFVYRDFVPHTIVEKRKFASDKSGISASRREMKDAVAKVKSGDHSGALEDYLRVYDRYKTLAAAENAAIIYELTGKIREAVDILQRAYDNTKDSRTYLKLAHLKKILEDRETLEREYSEAQKKANRENAQAQAQAAKPAAPPRAFAPPPPPFVPAPQPQPEPDDVESDDAEPDDAESDDAESLANAAVQSAPDPAEITVSAYNSFQRQDYDAAISDYDRALDLDPNNVYALLGRAAAYFNKGDYRRAIEEYTRCLLVAPSDLVLYGMRALAYMQLGENDMAAVNYRAILQLDPDNAEAKAALAALESPPDQQQAETQDADANAAAGVKPYVVYTPPSYTRTPLPRDRLRLGVTGGYTIPDLYYDGYESDIGSGYSLGLALHVPFTSWLSLVTEANYNYREIPFDRWYSPTRTLEEEVISVPVMIRFSTPWIAFRGFFEIGAQYGYVLSSAISLNNADSGPLNVKDRGGSELHWVFGGGFGFKAGAMVYFSYRCGLPLLDLQSEFDFVEGVISHEIRMSVMF